MRRSDASALLCLLLYVAQNCRRTTNHEEICERILIAYSGGDQHIRVGVQCQQFAQSRDQGSDCVFVVRLRYLISEAWVIGSVVIRGQARVLGRNWLGGKSSRTTSAPRTTSNADSSANVVSLNGVAHLSTKDSMRESSSRPLTKIFSRRAPTIPSFPSVAATCLALRYLAHRIDKTPVPAPSSNTCLSRIRSRPLD